MKESIWVISIGVAIIACTIICISTHLNEMKKVKKYNPNKIATKEGSIFPLNDNIISYKFFKKDISKPDNQGIQRFASQWEYFVEIQFIPATKKEKVKIYEITSYEYDLHTKR